jgi:tRNA threonylcarbamoyl adenosine modification protein YjeE
MTISNATSMNTSGECVISTLQELETWASEFAALLKPKTIVSISGDLGAGKTAFCQALLRALGYNKEVTSPTFALHHRYLTPTRQVDHFDLYRVEPRDRAFWTFFDETVEDADLALIEWPERYPFALPVGTLNLKITIMDGEVRHYSWRRK